MAHAYLCLACGQIIGRSVGGCIVCRSKNLVYYHNDRDPEMFKRQRKIRGLGPEAHPAHSNLIVAISLSVFMTAGWYVMNQWDELTQHPALLTAIGVFRATAAPATPAGPELASNKQKLH